MPPKRPRDPNQLAKSIIDIVTGQKVAMGKKGGKARAEGMTAKNRSEIAKKAAKARWD